MLNLSSMLLPELNIELANTRKMIEYLPEGHGEFKPHAKSSSLAQLAGHMVGLVDTIFVTLTEPLYDFSVTPPKRLLFETREQLLAEFNTRADKTAAAMKSVTNEAFQQTCTLAYQGKELFSGPRFTAYRLMGINHMIHHRAQVGVYLRLLDQPVPSTFGPTADESFKI